MNDLNYKIPNNVYKELQKGDVPVILEDLIKSSRIKIDSYDISHIVRDGVFHSLGDGELEAIFIALRMIEDGVKPDEYVLITDDKKAMYRADHLGIQVYDITLFLSICNIKGILSKHYIENILSKLNEVYEIDNIEKFLNSLKP